MSIFPSQEFFEFEFIYSYVPRPVAFHCVIEYTGASVEGHIGNKQISCSVQEYHNWRSDLANNVAVKIHNAKVDSKYAVLRYVNQAVTLKTSWIGINNQAVTIEAQVERQSVIK